MLSSRATAASRVGSTPASTAEPAPTMRPSGWSRTAPAWRRRSASRRSSFLTAYQIHSPDVVTIDRPWTAGGAPARRRDRDADAGDRHRRYDRGLRPGAVRGRAGAGDRRGACGLARRLHGRAGGHRRRDGALRRRPRAHRGRSGPDHPAAELRSGTGIRRTVHRCRRAKCPLFPAVPAAGPRHVRSAGLHRGAAHARPVSAGSRISAAAPTRIRRASSATGARPTPKSRTMAGTSTRSRSPAEAAPKN